MALACMIPRSSSQSTLATIHFSWLVYSKIKVFQDKCSSPEYKTYCHILRPVQCFQPTEHTFCSNLWKLVGFAQLWLLTTEFSLNWLYMTVPLMTHVQAPPLNKIRAKRIMLSKSTTKTVFIGERNTISSV